MAQSIPKIVFTYWVGEQFSYLHVLCLRSISKLHPNTSIRIYTDVSGVSVSKKADTLKEHATNFDLTFRLEDIVHELPNVEIIHVDMSKILGTEKPTFHVYCADFFRIYKLYEHGGVWFDLDMLFTKNLFDFLPKELPKGKSVVAAEVRHEQDVTVATGFIAATPKSPLLERMLSEARNSFTTLTKNNDAPYQTFGPNLWCKHSQPFLKIDALDLHPDILPIPTQSYLPYLWFEIKEYFFDEDQPSRSLLPLTFANHWYFGSNFTREFIASIQDNSFLDKNIGFVQDLKYLKSLGVDISVPNYEKEIILDNVKDVYTFEVTTPSEEIKINIPPGEYTIYVLGASDARSNSFNLIYDKDKKMSIPLANLCQESSKKIKLLSDTNFRFRPLSNILRVSIRREKSNVEHSLPGGLVTIVPLKDCEKYIERCLRSISMQTIKPNLICVIDDASSDNSKSIVESIDVGIPILLLANKVSIGPYVSKNIALNKLKSFFKFVSFLDSDDFIVHETYEMLSPWVIDDDSMFAGVYPHGFRMKGSKKEYFSPHPQTKLKTRRIFAGLFTKFSMFEEFGYFDCVRFGADGELDARIRNVKGFGIFKDVEYPLYIAELREDSLTQVDQVALKETSNPKDWLSQKRSLYAQSFPTSIEAKPPLNIPTTAPNSIRVFEAIEILVNGESYLKLQNPPDSDHHFEKVTITLHLNSKFITSFAESMPFVEHLLTQQPNTKHTMYSNIWGFVAAFSPSHV